jgi:putative endonuclease
MTQKSELGREGEVFAANYLKNKGYKILERNKREKWGELDIVAMAPDKTLVFVEVKTMKPGTLKPEDQMSAAKIRKFRRTAELYAGSHEELIKDEKGWRLDLIALVKKDGKFGEESIFEIRHYENI